MKLRSLIPKSRRKKAARHGFFLREQLEERKRDLNPERALNPKGLGVKLGPGKLINCIPRPARSYSKLTHMFAEVSSGVSGHSADIALQGFRVQG